MGIVLGLRPCFLVRREHLLGAFLGLVRGCLRAFLGAIVGLGRAFLGLVRGLRRALLRSVVRAGGALLHGMTGALRRILGVGPCVFYILAGGVLRRRHRTGSKNQGGGQQYAENSWVIHTSAQISPIRTELPTLTGKMEVSQHERLIYRSGGCPSGKVRSFGEHLTGTATICMGRRCLQRRRYSLGSGGSRHRLRSRLW